ncbi:MerC domain-containing protein [Aureivirga marina]|uniref:MerC domain-containing protein n=1 Tax=Aureivirga marina TaxID=1182451 RepID=UPI0018CB78F4|nr:MerC domain-containing protein [Aureivirga marina]
MKITLHKPDTFGVIAGTLCMIHCLATPVLFITQAYSVGNHELAPDWWKNLDYVFLFISFFAVYRSTQTSSKKFMKPSLWISWVLLFGVLINEKIELFKIAEVFTYVAALILVGLHLYNLKYCQCKSEECCVNNYK